MYGELEYYIVENTQNQKVIKYSAYLFILLFVVLIYIGREYQNLIIASIVGFFATMIGVAIALKIPTISPKSKAVSLGIGSGMMLSSAFLIIAPKSMKSTPEIGGIGIVLGILFGYAGHEFAHYIGHKDSISSLLYKMKVAELSGHAALAGSLMGVAYSTIPSLSLVFGFGIVAHKLPAGIVMTLEGEKEPELMLYPAAMVGVAGIFTAISSVAIPESAYPLIYGISTGLFAHIGLDMLPDCSSGGTPSHGSISCNTDIVRVYSAVSVTAGVAIIIGAWYLLP